jgi:hypothetical protein
MIEGCRKLNILFDFRLLRAHMMFNHLLIEQILVFRAYNPAVRRKEILGRHNKPFHSELGQRRITAN